MGKMLAHIDGPGGIIKIQPHPITAEEVIGRLYAIYVLQPNTVAAGAAIIGKNIILQGQAAAVQPSRYLRRQ